MQLAEQENTTKVEEEIKDGAAEGDGEDLMSLESLDSVLAEEDPEFAKSLNEIGPDVEGAGEIYEEGLELEYTLAEEEKLWQSATGLRAKLLKVLPFIPKLSYKIKMKRTGLRLSFRKFKEQLRHRVLNAGPLTVAWLKGLLAGFKKSVGEALAAFKGYSLIKKLSLVGLIVATGVGGFVLYRVSTKGLLPHSEDLFVRSLADWSSQRYQYDPKTETEPFYDSTRAAQNIFLMKRMVVNLRRSGEAGSNPMGAFEFYVEGAASDVVVEIKDREAEVEDLFLRTIEEMTFDQVSSAEGKQALCDRLRKDVNKILTKGYVRRIFIKTAIVKP
nr:hypothetical protein CKG001_06770 [Bdellovibrio sp. CKG001]